MAAQKKAPSISAKPFASSREIALSPNTSPLSPTRRDSPQTGSSLFAALDKFIRKASSDYQGTGNTPVASSLIRLRFADGGRLDQPKELPLKIQGENEHGRYRHSFHA